MIILNITYKVAHGIFEEWLHWQKSHHLPECMATGLFASYNMLKLVEEEDIEGHTFIIQLHTTEANYKHFTSHYDEAFRKAAYKKWGDQFIAFRTVLCPVN